MVELLHFWKPVCPHMRRMVDTIQRGEHSNHVLHFAEHPGVKVEHVITFCQRIPPPMWAEIKVFAHDSLGESGWVGTEAYLPLLNKRWSVQCAAVLEAGKEMLLSQGRVSLFEYVGE